MCYTCSQYLAPTLQTVRVGAGISSGEVHSVLTTLSSPTHFLTGPSAIYTGEEMCQRDYYMWQRRCFNCQDAEAAQQDEVDEAAEEAQQLEIAFAVLALLGRHDCGCRDKKKRTIPCTMVYFVALSNCARYYAACLSQGRAVLRGSRVRSIICPMGGERSSLLCFYIGSKL